MVMLYTTLLMARARRNHLPVAPASNITLIASGYVTNTDGSFDRSASIADIGAIPAGALIVVKGAAPGMDSIVITDTAGNAYTKGTHGGDSGTTPSGTFRDASLEYHCLSAKASAHNAFSLNITTNDGGGLQQYLIAVEVYSGSGAWAYLAAQSGVTQLSYSTADTVQSAAITTSAAGVATGILYNDSAGGTMHSFSPGAEIVRAPSQNGEGAGNNDTLSGSYIFNAAISAQKITAGVGVSGAYKYLVLNTSVFENS